MLTSTTTYKNAIRLSHKRRTRVDVYDADGNVRALDVPLIDGSVNASLTSRVTRTCSLRLTEDWFPDDVNDVFAPERAILRVRSGIEYPDGSEEIFPVFVGRVQNVSLNDSGQCQVTANDQALDVVDARFEAPRNSDTGISLVTQLQRLITEAVPDAVFGTNDVTDSTTPQLAWDEDRGRAVDDLAEALGGRWYTLGDGSFVIREFPYDNGTFVQTIDDGVTGLLNSVSIDRSRDAVANSVTVVSERADGTDPVRATARNTVPGSPTEYGDLFGRVSQIIKIQTPLTNSEAQRFARAQLNASTALTEQWSLTMIPDHTLEPGDPVQMVFKQRVAVQVIDSITYPLVLGGMTITTRAFTPEPTILST